MTMFCAKDISKYIDYMLIYVVLSVLWSEKNSSSVGMCFIHRQSVRCTNV